MASNSRITGPRSTNATHDPDAGYTEQVADNIGAAVNGRIAALDHLVDTQVAVLANRNASTEQKAASIAIGVSETMMAAIGTVTSATTQLSEAVMMPVMEKLAAFKGTATLPVCKQMDPVMGIDVHMIMFPPVPAPVPIPHPYVGISFRAKDFIACALATIMPTPDVAPAVTDESTSEEIDASNEQRAKAVLHAMASMAIGMIGATVKFGGYLPRTVAGTPTKSVIRHFPLGPQFHPGFSAAIEKDHGHALLGSFFVVADGSPLTGSPVHLHNDCWDVGIPSIHQIKPNKNADDSTPSQLRLYVPSGVIMPIPWTRPVLTNPVPAPINPLTAPLRIFKAAFAKLAHRMINKLPPGMRDGLHKAVCHITGHPVDVVSGMLFTDEEDFSLPGVIRFSWERTWFSDSTYKGPLGHGWYHNYDMWLSIDEEANRAIYRMSDGRGVQFALPGRGKFTFDRKEKLFLHRHAEEGFYYITDKEGLIYRFTDQRFMDENSKLGFGLLSSISNANCYSIRFEYTAKGHLQKVIDCTGRVLTIENDKEGRITHIYAPHPTLRDKTFVIAKYTYDEEGNMICHKDALEQQMLFKYENHLLVKETWRNGMNWFFVYDGKSTGARCIHTWGDGDIYNHKLTYAEGCTKVENSLGDITTYYHRNGLPYVKVDGNGAEWGYRYNKHNELEWETDPLGNQKNYSHDEWGNIVTTTDPGGGFTSTEYYHPKFPLLPTEAMDAGGGKWKWEYDERGNVREQVSPLGAKSKFAYSDGLLARIENAAGAVTALQYDKNQNLKSVQTDDGAVTEYTYDVLGNCTVITNPNGVKQRRTFDLKGRIEKVHDFDGNIIYLDYDGIDNVVRYADKQKEVEYTYRGLWKLTSRTEAGATIAFKYDTEEQLRKIINEHNLPYRFELDAAGNVTEEVGFDGITRRYERNAAGWVTQVLRPGGKFTKYNYDPCGRVTEVLYSDGKKEVYAYRPDGEVVVAQNEHSVVQFERDVMGNITKETANNEWVASAYDEVGNRLSIISSLGANIQHQYDKMGDVLHIQANGWEARFEHDKLGLEVSRLLPGGISSQWQRDGIGRPILQIVGHTAKGGFATRRRKQYSWDVNDRLKQIRDERGVTKFEHDTWSNLAKTIFPNGEEQLRNPDAVGNLFKTTDRNDRVYAKGGQLRKAGRWEYSYDAEGNLVKKEHVGDEVWLYEWNDAGMLTKVIRPDKVEITFAYDALSRRLWKQYKNTTTKFIWDGNVPLHEWKEHAVTGEKLSDLHVGGNGITTWLFDTGSFAPCGKIKGEKMYSIITDDLGTPTQMYKEDGRLFWECELDSYGKMRMENGEAGSCPFRYQGQYEDAETELFYNRFRYYTPEAGIYISQDPIRIGGGPSLYRYVTDTTRWVDMTGLATSYPKKSGPLHHIATNKNKVAGKRWTNRFAPFFRRAGLDMNGPENQVYVPGHHGPHPDAYHQHVYNKLEAATQDIDHRTDRAAYREAVRGALRDIANDAQTPGSQVNDWLTK